MVGPLSVLCVLTSASLLLGPYLYVIILVFLPMYLHRYALTIVSLPLYPYHCILTLVSLPLCPCLYVLNTVFVLSYLLHCPNVYTYQHASLIAISDISLLILLSSGLLPFFVITNSVI